MPTVQASLFFLSHAENVKKIVETEESANAAFEDKCHSVLNEEIVVKVKNEIKLSKEGLREVEQENDKLVVEDLKAEEDVEEVEKRESFAIFEDFSRTPCDEVVLKSFKVSERGR